MIRRRFWLPLLAVALSLSVGAPLLAQGPKAPAPGSVIRPLTTDQLAAWLCKALPTRNGTKVGQILFDGKVPGEADGEDWSGSVYQDDKRLVEVEFLSMNLFDVQAWILRVNLEGDWHGISEQDWVALARRIPGRVEKDVQGFNICNPEAKGKCEERGGYAVGPGVRRLNLIWGPSDPDPAAWFCARS